MAAWDLRSKRARIQDGDLVEAVGFVTHGRARPGEGFRDTKPTLEMHGRAGVPLYLRPLPDDAAGPRVRVEDPELESEVPAQPEEQDRASRSA